MYIMNSSLPSLLYVVGITAYAASKSYAIFTEETSYLYWLLLLLALPHYYLLNRRNPESNFTIVHNWVVPLSVIITLGTLSQQFHELIYIAYMSLFGLLLHNWQQRVFCRPEIAQ